MGAVLSAQSPPNPSGSLDSQPTSSHNIAEAATTNYKPLTVASLVAAAQPEEKATASLHLEPLARRKERGPV